MATDTYIVTKEVLEIPEGVYFEFKNGIYHISINMDHLDMMDFLEACKLNDELLDVYHSSFKPITDIIEELNIKNYAIDFSNDFAGQPDDEFIIPVVNGKIIRDHIACGLGSAPWDAPYKLLGINSKDLY